MRKKTIKKIGKNMEKQMRKWGKKKTTHRKVFKKNPQPVIKIKKGSSKNIFSK